MAAARLAPHPLESGVMQRYEARIQIDAPPAQVWEVLVDFERYAEWNPFVPKMSADLRIGGDVTLHVRRDPSSDDIKIFHETITELEPGRRLAYRVNHYRPWMMQAERWQILTPLDGGRRTEYWTHEDFRGVLTWFAGDHTRSIVEPGFRACAEGLKEFTEKRGERPPSHNE